MTEAHQFESDDNSGQTGGEEQTAGETGAERGTARRIGDETDVLTDDTDGSSGE